MAKAGIQPVETLGLQGRSGHDQRHLRHDLGRYPGMVRQLLCRSAGRRHRFDDPRSPDRSAQRLRRACSSGARTQRSAAGCQKTSACSPKARNPFQLPERPRAGCLLAALHPRYIGAIRDALDYVKDKIEIELNAVTTTRCFFPDDRRLSPAATSTANRWHWHLTLWALPARKSQTSRTPHRAHGQRSSFQRSDPIPDHRGRRQLRYMIVQYSAASMVSEEQGAGIRLPGRLHPILCKPGGHGFDGYHRQKIRLDRSEHPVCLADELLTACQAIGHPPQTQHPTVRASLRFIRRYSTASRRTRLL